MCIGCQLSGKPAAAGGGPQGELVNRGALGTVPKGCGINGRSPLLSPGAHGGVQASVKGVSVGL